MICIDSVMTSNLYTLKQNDTLQDARILMTARHIHHVPVVNKDNELLGLVSHRDILSAMDSKREDRSPEDIGKQNKIRLSDLMTKNVFTLSPHDNLLLAAKEFQKNKSGSIPVVDGNKLVGLVTSYDFINLVVEILEAR